MTLKTIKIIFAILLLIASAGYAEKSATWKYQKEQSWERARSDFPESAVEGPFLSRMVEIDNWAKENDRSLYDDSNKPYLMAMMVQQEIDEAKAKESARPATVVDVQEPEAVNSEEWVDNLISYAIGGVFALIIFQILRPSARSQGPKARGMSCVAWAVATTTFLGFPVSLSTCILFAIVFAPIAFLMGWVYESICGKSLPVGDKSIPIILKIYAYGLNIDGSRASEILTAVDQALVIFSKSRDLDDLAHSLIRTCPREEEARFFCRAVRFLLEKTYGAKPRDISVITAQILHHCQKIIDARDAAATSPPNVEPEPSHDSQVQFQNMKIPTPAKRQIALPTAPLYDFEDEIKLLTKMHAELREKRASALRELEFEEVADLMNKMDELRDQQFDSMMKEIERLKSK